MVEFFAQFLWILFLLITSGVLYIIGKSLWTDYSEAKEHYENQKAREQKNG
jgi:H+/Cl- antiporter ClcA